MYIFSFIVLLMIEKFLIKALSAISFALFGTNLYVEFFGSPEDWTRWDKAMFVAFCANLMLALFIVEKIKNKK